MDWEVLRPVIVGGLIATIPILISNLVQIYLKRMEIKQKEKEAKIQDKKKWIERDVLEIMDSTDKILELLSESHFLSVYGTNSLMQMKDLGLVTEDEHKEKLKLYIEQLDNLNLMIKQKRDTINRLVYSFDDEISSEYEIFGLALVNFLNERLNYKDNKVVDAPDAWLAVRESAGNLQKILREKLISIRDTA
jgi:hypothetical protein